MSAFACSLGCGRMFRDNDGMGLERCERHEAKCNGSERVGRKSTQPAPRTVYDLPIAARMFHADGSEASHGT